MFYLNSNFQASSDNVKTNNLWQSQSYAQKPKKLMTKLPNTEAKRWRVAFYSHDTMGLGHKRRNLLIAQNLGISPTDADILMITGMGEATQFKTTNGIDFLTLPALYKNINGEYEARRWEMSLEEIIDLRSQIIYSTLKSFQPEIFIVDNVPRGAMGELNPTLKYLQTKGKTYCILGLRDILDEPSVIRRDWKRAKNEEAIRSYYDQVWIYGDPKVYNPLEEYNFAPDIRAKFRYTGYLDQRLRLEVTDRNLNKKPKDQRLALCMVGGGQDGGDLAQAFAQTPLPPNTKGIIITGPLMPKEIREQLHLYAQNRSNLTVLEYVPEPTLLLQQADWVISMGGYNTTCEILSWEKQALIVPRVKPRKEQLIRVQRLQELGLVDMLHPAEVTPESLQEWLHKKDSLPQVHKTIDFRGLRRIPKFVGEILTQIDSHKKRPMIRLAV
jgi:predicted glycosyltransferase